MRTGGWRGGGDTVFKEIAAGIIMGRMQEYRDHEAYESNLDVMTVCHQHSVSTGINQCCDTTHIITSAINKHTQHTTQ